MLDINRYLNSGVEWTWLMSHSCLWLWVHSSVQALPFSNYCYFLHVYYLPITCSSLLTASVILAELLLVVKQRMLLHLWKTVVCKIIPCYLILLCFSNLFVPLEMLHFSALSKKSTTLEHSYCGEKCVNYTEGFWKKKSFNL